MSGSKKRTLGQFIGRYVRLIVLLYVVYLLTYFLFYAVSARRALDERQEASAAGASIYLEMMMGNISQIVFNLQSSPSVYNIMHTPLTASPGTYAQAYAELNKQAAQMELIEGCYLYIKSSETVLSTNEGKYELAQFYDAPFLRRIGRGESPALSVHRPPERPLALVQDDVFTVATRFSTVMRDNAGYLCVNISLSRLREGLKAFAGTGGIVVSGRDGMLVDVLPLMPLEREAFTTTRSLNAYGLQVTAVTGRAAFYKALLADFFKSSAFFLVFSLLAGLLLMLLLSALNKTFRPMVYQLADLYKKREAAESLSLDELGRFFEKLVKDRREFSTRLEETARVARDKLLLDMLTGSIDDAQEFERLCRHMHVDFPHRWFVVLCVSAEGREEARTPREVAASRALIRKALEREGDPVLYTTLDGDTDIVGIANYSDAQARTARGVLEELAKQARAALEERGTLDVFLSVSRPADSPQGIPAAYARAKYNAGHKYGHASRGCLFDEEDAADAAPLLPDAQKKRVLAALGAGNSGALYECLRELAEDGAEVSGAQALDTLRAKLLILTGVILDVTASGHGAAALRNCMECARGVLAADSAGDMRSAFRALLGELSRETPPSRGPCDMNRYILKALDFIDASYGRELSVREIAEHLNLNDKYLSRLFKERTGRTMMQYLSDLRVEKAEELLRQTGLTVREVGELAGFGESRSFIRHFKKSFGLTPGEYRAREKGPAGKT